MGIFTETLKQDIMKTVDEIMNLSEDERDFYNKLGDKDKKVFFMIKAKHGFNLTDEERKLHDRYLRELREKYSSRNKERKTVNDDRPFFIKYPIFLVIFLIAFAVMCLKMCSDNVQKGDPFGIETTIRSHGSHGE